MSCGVTAMKVAVPVLAGACPVQLAEVGAQRPACAR